MRETIQRSTLLLVSVALLIVLTAGVMSIPVAAESTGTEAEPDEIEVDHPDAVGSDGEFEITVQTINSAGTVVEIEPNGFDVELISDAAVQIDDNRVEFLDPAVDNSSYTIIVDVEGGTANDTVEIVTWMNAEHQEAAAHVTTSSVEITPDTPADVPEIVYDTNFLPEKNDTIEVEITATVPESKPDVIESYSAIWFRGESVDVRQADGFEDRGDQIIHDRESPTATATVQWNPTVENSRFDGIDFGASEEWAFVHMSQTGFDGFEQRFKPDGALGENWAFIGEHDRYSHQGYGQEIDLIVPEAADMSEDPNAVLDSLLYESRHLRVDARNEQLTVFATTDPIRGGGLASGNNLEVRADEGRELSGNTWGHEYVHTRQEATTLTDADWLTEAEATYYQHLLAYKQEHLQRSYGSDPYFTTLQESLEIGDSHTNVTLADPDTWQSRSDYDKGALVLAALDAEIRGQTNNERNYQDVFRELNQKSTVGHDDFAAAVETVVGEPMDEFMNSYVLGNETPAPPDDPSLYTRGEHTFDINYSVTLANDKKKTAIPGETIDVPIEIHNTGADAGVAVEGTLSTGDLQYDETLATEIGPNQTVTDTVTVTIPENEADGLETLALNLTDADGITANTAVGMDIIDPPSAAIEIEGDGRISEGPPSGEDVIPLLAEETVILNANSSDTDAPVTTYAWDLGPIDKETDDPSVSRTFAEPGTYTVGVTLGDKYGYTNTTTTEVVVTDQPQLNINVPDATVDADDEVELDAIVDNEIGDTEVRWEFPDGTTTTGSKIEHVFEPGEHEITVVATDQYGVATNKSVIVTAEEPEPTDSIPGFGVSVGVAVMVMLGLYLARRRS